MGMRFSSVVMKMLWNLIYVVVTQHCGLMSNAQVAHFKMVTFKYMNFHINRKNTRKTDFLFIQSKNNGKTTIDFRELYLLIWGSA